jgi:hypothetical protein
MESVYHIVTIHVNETSWVHVWWLHSRYLGTGYDNHSQTVAIGFEAQTDEKPSKWFSGQTTHKPSTLVLRLNQETHTPRLHLHRADRTRCHPTSRPPSHRVPDLCDHPQSSALGLLLLPRSSLLHAIPHLPPAHHETSKHDSPNERRIKEKQNNLSRI